ncbi:MAG: 3-isopropylmalate dehydratase small subunit [Nitrososphaeria archaeon]
MDRMGSISGKVAPLFAENVDTDQIIPAEYLKLLSRRGLGRYLFYTWRYDERGQLRRDFLLNDTRFDGAVVLVAGKNFGIGSSREFAVWALLDYGFKAVIAPSFGDIFYGNALKSGLLCIRLSEDRVRQLQEWSKDGRLTAEIDLRSQEIRTNRGERIRFEVDPVMLRQHSAGLDEIGLTLGYEESIRSHESSRPKYLEVDKMVFLA